MAPAGTSRADVAGRRVLAEASCALTSARADQRQLGLVLRAGEHLARAAERGVARLVVDRGHRHAAGRGDDHGLLDRARRGLADDLRLGAHADAAALAAHAGLHGLDEVPAELLLRGRARLVALGARADLHLLDVEAARDRARLGAVLV